MPIYMDRHDILEELSDIDIAQVHQADLLVQDKFDCRVLTYWYDKVKKTAFCLVEAPNKQAMLDMHAASHGQVPHKVIEVSEGLIDAFLGNIEHKESGIEPDLFFNKDSPRRTIVALKYTGPEASLDSILELVSRSEGSVVKQNVNNILISFVSATRAVEFALNSRSAVASNSNSGKLKVGISANVPVTNRDQLFESAVLLAERMCNLAKDEVVVSSEVKDAYKRENRNTFIDRELVHALKPADEAFLSALMDYIEKSWDNPDLSVDDLGREIGYSKSQLYRKVISLTGKSANRLLKDYRLSRALELIDQHKGNISQIAFETGFNSPAYFSKCFQEKYGMLPSEYSKQSS